MATRHPDPKPDRFEYGVRFACGFLLGALIGFYAWGRWFGGTTPGIAAIPAGGVLCGLGAALFGDRFWHDFVGSIGIDP